MAGFSFEFAVQRPSCDDSHHCVGAIGNSSRTEEPCTPQQADSCVDLGCGPATSETGGTSVDETCVQISNGSEVFPDESTSDLVADFIVICF